MQAARALSDSDSSESALIHLQKSLQTLLFSFNQKQIIGDSYHNGWCWETENHWSKPSSIRPDGLVLLR